MSSEQDVAELLAKQVVHDTILRYLRGVDRLDAELVQSAYHADADDDHGGYTWKGAGLGETIIGLVRGMFTSTVHLLGNHLIEINGDEAASEAYVLGYYTASDDQGGYLLVRALRYMDRFERRADGWKIIQRRLVREWDYIDRNSERPPDRAYIGALRSREDISYELLPGSPAPSVAP